MWPDIWAGVMFDILCDAAEAIPNIGRRVARWHPIGISTFTKTTGPPLCRPQLSNYAHQEVPCYPL